MKVEEASRRGNVVKLLDNALGSPFSKKSLLFRMHGFHVNCRNDYLQNQRQKFVEEDQEQQLK